jgi:tetratricopeptide (TPR) repeat protein
MGVPIHTWQPADIQSVVGKRVVLSAVVGPKPIADKVQQKMLALAPQDTGRNIHVTDAASLQSDNIRLVSGVANEPNDLALTSISRQAGVDFLLRGQVLEDRPTNANADGKPQKLMVSWRLTPIRSQQHPEGSPVVVDLESAVQRYPDLALQSDPIEVLTTAAVRDTYRLFTPSIERDRVQLAIPYALFGSREVRRGNVNALAGRWGEAEKIWAAVVEEHPSQSAAVHNLALAAAASQDFSRAKELARKAIRMQPTSLHKNTLVWIELQQREYHECFNLADPPEGWFVTSEEAVNDDR